ncbi:hypothetical protein RRG08_025885 [Elysia crispata]|uniref:Uncharacterized protein n=1 Tax=Elysia crispata TaxID=231223 RepID=A0AAE1DJP1_9GAST|nr:hypothetical protein RRG08_025885 [Elysia crispata]
MGGDGGLCPRDLSPRSAASPPQVVLARDGPLGLVTEITCLECKLISVSYSFYRYSSFIVASRDTRSV